MEHEFGVSRNLIKLKRCKCILLKESLDYHSLPRTTWYIWKQVETPYFYTPKSFIIIIFLTVLPDHRLPKILAPEVRSKNICWWKEWLPLLSKHEVQCVIARKRDIFFHFIGKCEILKEFSLAWLDKAKLDNMEVIQLLNDSS